MPRRDQPIKVTCRDNTDKFKNGKFCGVQTQYRPGGEVISRVLLSSVSIVLWNPQRDSVMLISIFIIRSTTIALIVCSRY